MKASWLGQKANIASLLSPVSKGGSKTENKGRSAEWEECLENSSTDIRTGSRSNSSYYFYSISKKNWRTRWMSGTLGSCHKIWVIDQIVLSGQQLQLERDTLLIIFLLMWISKCFNSKYVSWKFNANFLWFKFLVTFHLWAIVFDFTSLTLLSSELHI